MDFLFYYYGGRRDLHSFPTRRSSDLAGELMGHLVSEKGNVAVFIGMHATTDHEQKRSEEHTSELQSRGHLVCRLLLEKKKTPFRDTGRLRVSWRAHIFR